MSKPNEHYNLWLSMVSDSLDVLTGVSDVTHFATEMTWISYYTNGLSPMEAVRDLTLIAA